MKYLFLIYLFVSAVVDIRTQKLSSMWIYSGLIGIGAYAIWQLAKGVRAPADLICSLLPGIVCYVFASISKAMGRGDALLIFGMGMGFSLIIVTKILMLAFFLAAVGSMGLLIFKRNWKNRRIPFIPYLFLASGYFLLG